MSLDDGSKSLSKGVFRNFKMILANTGLIQMLTSYKKGKTHDAILGYGETPVEVVGHATATGKTREMIFCVNYFLRYNDIDDPRRWQYATQWVFALVDEYLQMGRDKTTNWRPHGWLMAAVEFPVISFPLDSFNKIHTLTTDWIDKILCYFDLSKGRLEIHSMPAALVDSICCLNLRQLLQFQSSAFRFALSLLIGITLSAAVLKNAFEHACSIQNESDESQKESNEILQLIKVQLMKIYDLRLKSDVTDALLSSVELALRRLLSNEEQPDIDESGKLIGQRRRDKPDVLVEVC